MRVPLNKTVVRILLGLVALAATGLVLLSSEDVPVYTSTDKAFYADAETINFVRPGVKIQIVGTPTIEGDGTLKVRFKLTDLRGAALDRLGVESPGPVQTRWTVAYIPKGQEKYSSYTVREVTSTYPPANGAKANQALDDTGSRTNANYQKVGDGEYVFTFNKKIPTDYQKNATHTIGVWVNRDLATEFDLSTVQNQTSLTYSWVPDGSAVQEVRDVIRTESCNACHGVIRAHDNREGLDLCILCHQPQTVDPDTGNNLDMAIMTHRIHMGAELPSVVAGGKYVIVGFGNTPHDYSHVEFPAENSQCTVCHSQTTGAKQAKDFMMEPTRADCGSCHDNIKWETGENHFNMPMLNDNACSRCHVADTGEEFDASITGAHVVLQRSRELKGVTYEIKDLRDVQAGKNPTIVLSLKDKSGNPIPKLSRLSVVMAGPTMDYAKYWSEDLSTTPIASDGTLTYTFKNAIPADAKGSFAFGVEGRNEVKLSNGATVRDAGPNVVKFASVDGSPVQPHPTTVALEKCQQCHSRFAFHGDNRNTVSQCELCHNPNTTDAAVRPKTETTAARTLDLAYMVHRIHGGPQTGAEHPYVVYGRGSSRYDFSELGYPADPRRCEMCHVNNSERLPVRDESKRIDVQDPGGVLNPMGPISTACLGCHATDAAASHALTNVTRIGEACDSCHGTGREFSVEKSHAR